MDVVEKSPTIWHASGDRPASNASAPSLGEKVLAGGARCFVSAWQQSGQPVESHVRCGWVGIEKVRHLSENLPGAELAEGEREPELDAAGVRANEAGAQYGQRVRRLPDAGCGQIEGALLVAVTAKAKTSANEGEALVIGATTQPALHVGVAAWTAPGLHQCFWIVLSHGVRRRLTP